DNWANLSDLKMTLDAAVAWANRHSDNQLLSENDYYQAYFEMRANQYELLRQMQDSLDRIETPVMQAAVISDALAMTASVLNEDNPAAQLVTMVKKIQRDFAASPLPTDRASFESRARLFYFLEDFSRLLQLKRNFNHIISSQN
ncbi:membrane protein, partial [Lacticaseibacillus rhamnosus]